MDGRSAGRSSQRSRQRGGFGATRNWASVASTVAATLFGPVTALVAQPAGAPLAAPIVHELRATVSAVSRTTLNAPQVVGDGLWMSSIDAVTNVAIDVLLLAPDDDDLASKAVQIVDVDGVRRWWSDGPVVVARGLLPGRHKVSMQWTGAALSDSDKGRVAARMRTTARPSPQASR